jgi:arylsulfatase A-like enzyme
MDQLRNHEPKNILFIFTDQMHRYALGCMGTPDIKTPNLDQLAKDGVLFRSAYSTCPLCTPFRINLFTGMYSHQTNTYRNNLIIPPKVVSLAAKFNQAGYETSYVGKWHIGATGNKPIPKEIRGDFTHFIGYQCYNEFNHNTCFYDEQNQEHRFNKHRTEVTTDLAIERLEKIKDRPFFMCVAYQAPHYPVQPLPQYDEMYKGVKIQRRPNTKEIDPYTKTHSPPGPLKAEECPDYQRYGKNLDEYLRLYYAMVTQIDANVGRLLQKVDDWGLRKNSLIIFTSDHGDMQGAHGLKNKQLPYEESAGIPLIVQAPGGSKKIVTDVCVSTVDFHVTCLDFAGISPTPDLPGRSFAPFLYDSSYPVNWPVLSEMRFWKMIRKNKIKLVTKGFWNAPSEVYDLEKDSYEMMNLVRDLQYQDQIKQLRHELKQILKTTKKI